MSNIKGKIEESKFTNEWKGPKGIIYYHSIKVDGTEGQIGSKDKEPDFLKVGQEIEVSVTATDRGNRFKRVKENNFSFGGGKTKTRSLAETKRQAKGTALKAAATIHKTFSDLVIDGSGMSAFTNFIIGDINGELAKWDDPKSEEMMWRQSCLHTSCEEIEARGLDRENIAEKLIEIAQKKYEYIYK